MNFEQNKFGHPFNGGNQYFNQLSARIQQRAGIDVIKINDHVEPKIEFTKKQKQMPVQLTVEFGFPLTAEKIEKEEVATLDLVKPVENVIEIQPSNQSDKSDVRKLDVGEIHIEPLNVQPNATPYWHEFNADDELEGLVLDSEGQEMSDITITGDGIFDLDQQIFHEILPESIVEAPIVDEVIQEITPLQNTVETKVEDLVVELPSDIANENNETFVVLDIADEVVENSNQSQINEIELVKSDESILNIVSSEINDAINSSNESIESVSPNVDAQYSNNDSLPISDNGVDFQLGKDVIPSFSFSFIPEIEPVAEADETLSNAVIETTIQSVTVEHTAEKVSSIQVDESIVEPIIAAEAAPVELSFSDADLDAIHDEYSAKEMSLNETPSKTVVAEIKEFGPTLVEPTSKSHVDATIPEMEFSDADLDMLHNQMANESSVAYVKSAAGSKVNIPVFEDATDETANPKLTWMDLIPWSSVFGVVASLMAIAAAWFIWNSIQKPMAIDEFIDKAVISAPVSQPVSETNTVTENLSPEEYIATSIIEDATAENMEESTFNFTELSERSRVSAVELEKLGLTSLNLEDPFFEESIF